MTSWLHRIWACAVMAGALLMQPAEGADKKPDFGPNVLVSIRLMSVLPCRRRSTRFMRGRNTANLEPIAMLCYFFPANITSTFQSVSIREVIGLGASPDAVRIVGNVHADAVRRAIPRPAPSGARARGLLGHAEWRGDAVGGFAGSAVSPHACAGRHCAPSEGAGG